MLSVSIRVILCILFVNWISISHAQSKTATTILLFGDSIIAGYGLQPQDFLSAQLEKSYAAEGLDIKVVNGGVSGDTTSGGRSRLEWTITKYNPDIIFIALGGNDILRGISTDIARENLDAMLAGATAKNKRVILSAVIAPANLGVEYMNNFNKIYPDLAKKYNVPLYPFLLQNIFGNATFMQSDGIHPTASGVKEIAKSLAPYLLKNLPETQ